MRAAADSIGPMLVRQARVASRRRETPDTVSVGLEPLDGEDLAFEPGQFAMVYAFGVGEAPLSFSGWGERGVVHTVRSVGAVTRAVASARRGDVLGWRGPYGSGWNVDAAEGSDVVIVGGGIGLAPLRPVVDAVIANRQRYGRIVVLVGARSPDGLLFRRDLDRWRSASGLQVSTTVDVADSSWRGNVGVVTELLPRVRFDPLDTVAFVCGPEAMMRITALALAERGVPPERVRVSLERNMMCAVGHCGHCQLGPEFLCLDGPVFSFARVAPLLAVKEL